MLLLASLERTLNALLARDPAAPNRLAPMAGRCILLRMERPALALAVHFHPAGLDLLLDLDLDWEGELATWLGDIPAHSLAEGLRSLGRWGLRTRQELFADVSEYVFEEARLLPGRHQLEALRDHLTELEVATDRLEARLARLRRLIAGGEPRP